jgi:signal transduction histidine kinase
VLELIAFLLEEEGYRVLLARSGEAALAVLQLDKPDLIISDVMMPGLSGFELYEQICANAEWAHIPFIFLTAKDEKSDVRRGMGLGADDYLTKPFAPEDLLTAVQVRLMRAARTQAAVDEAAADLKEAIVETLTHEFRTPMALIMGYTELLETTGLEMNEEVFQATLLGLHEGSQRLMHLIEDFLLLSRLNSGSLLQEIRDRPQEIIEPDPNVERAIEQYVDQIGSGTLSFTLSLGGEGLQIAVAKRHLIDIVTRLVDNAVKFTEGSGGQVLVSTRRDGQFWSLKVTDDGPGIQRQALPTVFEAFRQVDRQKHEQQGAGVGLAIVRGVTEAYGGRVAVKSTPGKGARFAVWLPLVGV